MMTSALEGVLRWRRDGEVSHAATMFALSILSLGTRGKVDNGFPETYEGTPLGDALATAMALLELVSRTKSAPPTPYPESWVLNPKRSM